MDFHQSAGKLLLLGGLILAVVGLLVYFFGDKISFLGRLPGDIRIERENFRFYFPITTMLLLSLLLTILFNLIKRFF